MRQAGADLIMLEMMIEIDRMRAVYEGAKTSGLPIWAGLSCAPDEAGVMRLQNRTPDANGHKRQASGETLSEAITALKTMNIPLLSIMHTDVRFIDACLDVVQNSWDGLVGIYAHSGVVIDQKWVFEGTISPAEYADYAAKWLKRDIHLLGGCCGIRPDHIHDLRPLVYPE